MVPNSQQTKKKLQKNEVKSSATETEDTSTKSINRITRLTHSFEAVEPRLSRGGHIHNVNESFAAKTHNPTRGEDHP
jgi:hypothetical protein